MYAYEGCSVIAVIDCDGDFIGYYGIAAAIGVPTADIRFDFDAFFDYGTFGCVPFAFFDRAVIDVDCDPFVR